MWKLREKQTVKTVLKVLTHLEQQLVLGDSLDGFDQVITDGHPTADLMLDLLQVKENVLTAHFQHETLFKKPSLKEQKTVGSIIYDQNKTIIKTDRVYYQYFRTNFKEINLKTWEPKCRAVLPQKKSRTRWRWTLTWACSDSKLCTCVVDAPADTDKLLVCHEMW